MIAEVVADPDAKVGPRSVKIAGVDGEQPFYLYKTVDYISITPERGYGRPGGTRGPKVNQQFEAIAFTHGPDGKPVNIGRVGPLKWDVAERVSRIGDDDVLYVGQRQSIRNFYRELRRAEPRSASIANPTWATCGSRRGIKPDPSKPPMGARAFMLLMPPKFVFNPIN